MAKVIVHPDKAAAAKAVAAVIRDLIVAKAKVGQTAVLGLATGSTPLPLYAELIRLHREEGLSFRNVVSFNLDEYEGLSGDHPQSYRYFMEQNLFRSIDIPAENTHVPAGVSADATRTCAEYEAAIRAAGGIDLQVLGIGRTGHIGFNEPPSALDSRTRR
ncbi:MAG: glucosamine-6-phosphate deaminase, partial [Verrucomicrobiota bacterium]